ncbi:MAG: hypothetical protein H0V60_08240 [Actinobacteria bacterium]|nr:hypothetical protein [Actinomycetota bacterium]
MVSELGDVLEAIYGSHRSWSEVTASGSTGSEAWRMWVRRPNEVRVERDLLGGKAIAVRAGARWWMSHPRHGLQDN